MTKRSKGIILIVVVILIAGYFGITYNSLVKKDEKVKLQWNEVQNTYQRRLDLIPSLVNVVQGGAQYEQNTLKKVTDARAKAASINVGNDASPEVYNQQTQAQNELADAANRLVIAVENYPDLQGTKAFVGLQVQLEGTERRIKVARSDFNASIADYNSLTRSFPAKLVAGTFGFKPKEGFQSDEGANKSVEIKF